MTTATEYHKLKQNTDFVEKEKQRINNINKSRYANDPEYKEKVKSNVRQRRERLKQERLNTVNNI
jgi:flagellum-specific peptidoglycan hydrolase FlgJ